MAQKPKIVESIQAAAVALSVPPLAVKRAKEANCPAFKPGNRINLDELSTWISENPEKVTVEGDSLDLKEQKLSEEVRKLKIGNDSKEGKLMPRAQHEAEVREMSSEVQKQLYAIPGRAPELAGLPVANIEQRLTAMIDAAVAALRSA